MDIQRPPSKQPLPENATRVFKGEIFEVYQWQQEMFDGSIKTFEKLKRPDTAMVIPIIDNDKIMIIEQEQPGKKKFLGLPCGRIDEGEDVLAAAKRELLEETGYEAKEFALWDARQPISKIDWAIYTFIAKGCQKVAEQNLDSGEKIAVKFVSFEEFIELSFSGELHDMEVMLRLVDYGLRTENNPQKLEELKKEFFQ